MRAIRFRIGKEGRAGEENLALSLTIAVAVLVAMFNAIPVVAQQPTEDNAADAPRSDAISGRVVNVNGQPLANATVTVREFDSRTQGWIATTDNEGTFRVSGWRPAYMVCIKFLLHLPRDPASSQPNYYRWATRSDLKC